MEKLSQNREGLPANAKLVFNGVIFEVWQWEQEMFDGTKQIFEKIWRPPTVEIIATVGDKILIEEQDQPDRKNYINLPGGRADKGEDALEEAKRELLEETGYQSDDWSLLSRYSKDGKILQQIYFFVAKNCKKVQELNLDAGERIKTKLISFEDLLELTEEPRFWVLPEFANYLLRARFEKKRSEELKKILFS